MANKDEDWKFNINRANEIVRLYGNQTAYFANLILSFIVSYNVLFLIFNVLLKYIMFDTRDFLVILSLFVIYLIISIFSLLAIIYSRKTKKTLASICHFRENEYFDEDKPFNCKQEFESAIEDEKFKKIDFEKDYKAQLYNLLRFQKSYLKEANIAKYLLTFNVIVFIIHILVSIYYVLT